MNSILIVFLVLFGIITMALGLGTAVIFTNIVWKLAGVVLVFLMLLGIGSAIFDSEGEKAVEKIPTLICIILMLVGIIMIFTDLL